MQGGTALRNLKCVQLRSRVGIRQRDLVQGAYLRRTAPPRYPSYAKVTELKRRVSNKSLRNAKEPDLVRLSTRSPGREGMPAKIPAAGAGAAAGASRGGTGGRGREERDGR